MIGERVAWRTCKFDFVRYGKVVAVVPPGADPEPYIKALGKGYYSGACRTISNNGDRVTKEDESYLIAGAKYNDQVRLLWPKPRLVKPLPQTTKGK